MNREAKYYKATQKLIDLVNSSPSSRSQIARDGKLSKETLSKALKGQRVTRAKANGIILGIKANHSDITLVFNDVFIPAD